MVKYIFLLCYIVTMAVNANEPLLVDPTTPLDYKVAAGQKAKRPALPKLNSILVANKDSAVILNNQLYHTGHWVNGYQITKINKNSILLRYKEKSYKLSLYSKKERFIK